jgi:hypothetical protein
MSRARRWFKRGNPPSRRGARAPSGRSCENIARETGLKAGRRKFKSKAAARLAGSGELGDAREALEFGVSQLESSSGDVFLEMLDGGSAGDREHDGGALEKPGEGDLFWRGVVGAGDLVEDFAGCAARSEREPGNEADGILFAVVHDVIPFAVGETIAVLDGDDGNDAAGALDVLLGDVRESDEANLSFFLELGEGADGFLERNDWIGNVELIDINAIELEALEAAFDGFAKVSGGGVVSPLIGAGTVPATFGSDDEAGRIRMQGFGDELFADVGTVGIGSVYEIDTEFDGAAKNGKGRFAVFGRAPDAVSSEAHGAKAETMDRELGAERESAGCRSGDGSWGHDGLRDLQFTPFF